MHDEHAEGNAYFKCDFCQSPWSEDRPMVEGHRGSLICGSCLSLAWREVVLGQGGPTPASGDECRMCLQTNDAPHWPSPLDPGALICMECIERAARTLEKDPDTPWNAPRSE